MLRTRSFANSSKHPTCAPATIVIFSPASIGMMSGAAKCRVKSISPRASLVDWPYSRIGRHVADVGEAFRPQQLPGDILRRNANTGNSCEPDDGRFRRRFLGKRIRCADESCGAGRRQRGQKAASILHHVHDGLSEV